MTDDDETRPIPTTPPAPPPAAEPEPTPAEPAPAEPSQASQAWRTLRRPSRGQLLAGLLLGVLGFSVVVQARQTQETGLASLRQSELIRLLDDVTLRSQQLEREAAELEAEERALREDPDNLEAAADSARRRLDALGILAGTVPAEGPGVRLDIGDPDGAVRAALLLDTVQELRDAGAEAIQVGDVRVVADTAFTDADDGGVRVGEQRLTPPYRFLAIGDPQTMASALDIPGGVLEALRGAGARGEVERSDALTVTALRQVSAPQYAQPAPARTP